MSKRSAADRLVRGVSRDSDRCGFVSTPRLEDASIHVRRWNLLLVVLLAACVLASLGCWSPPKAALDLIEDAIAANDGHMLDVHDELPVEAEEVAQDNHDAWQQLRKILDGTPLDEDAAARRDGRAR